MKHHTLDRIETVENKIITHIIRGCP